MAELGTHAWLVLLYWDFSSIAKVRPTASDYTDYKVITGDGTKVA